MITEPCVIWRQSGRRGVFDVSLTPPEQPYEGELVVLTDRLSCSSSEEFAGGLQALGRALVVGERTPGVVLIAETLRLDIGATLVYPVAQAILADGSTLEGRGVIPDIEVELSRTALAEGQDEILDTAVEHIRSVVTK